MIVSGSGSITGSVVQILRIIKSFSSTLCEPPRVSWRVFYL
ncbi:hypothetical protein B230_2071 [Escherichia coli 14A]|nr:hypothetical protein B230_2071 [Escherichia coli 14A]